MGLNKDSYITWPTISRSSDSILQEAGVKTFTERSLGYPRYAADAPAGLKELHDGKVAPTMREFTEALIWL